MPIRCISCATCGDTVIFFVDHGGSLVDSPPFARRVVGSNLALATT